jgi:hypothetical protein
VTSVPHLRNNVSLASHPLGNQRSCDVFITKVVTLDVGLMFDGQRRRRRLTGDEVEQIAHESSTLFTINNLGVH